MILLDTHAFYWFITEDEKLPKNVKDVIEESEDVFISIVSFWEMAIKSSRGNLALPAPIGKLMSDCGEMDISILPIGPHHLDRLADLPFIHKDPFDRLIICQAMEEGMTILRNCNLIT